MTDITELKAKVYARVYDVLREAGVDGGLSAEIAGKAAQAVGTDLRADLDSLRRRVEAIEDRHKKLDEALLALKREWAGGP